MAKQNQDQQIQRTNANGNGNGGGAMTIKDVLSHKVDALRAVATEHLSAEKLVKIIGASMTRTPALLQCTPMSVLQAAMTCAELGLAPGPLGSIYLIPFKNNKAGGIMECQLIVGYRGLMELARRSGKITTIQAAVVREGDEFEFEYGLEMNFRHRPRAPLSAKVTHAWAFAKFTDGSYQLEVMTREQIDGIRRQSKASGNGPWVTHYDEMAKKTALRRLCKYLPLTVEAEKQIAVADRTEFDFDAMADVAGQVESEQSAGAIADRVSQRAAQGDPDPGEGGAKDPAGGDEKPILDGIVDE